MPGILWYFVIALVVIFGVILAVPSDGAEIPEASAAPLDIAIETQDEDLAIQIVERILAARFKAPAHEP